MLKKKIYAYTIDVEPPLLKILNFLNENSDSAIIFIDLM